MRHITLVIGFVLAGLVSPALGQEQTPPATVPGQNEVAGQETEPAKAPSRYTFNRVNDGFLRLDNETGQIAFCSTNSVGWGCQAVPEDRAALEKEIARLQDEVTSLKNQVAALREPPSPPRPPADLTPPPDKSVEAAKLREDIARARVAVENAWRRLVEMIVNFQKDVMRKG